MDTIKFVDYYRKIDLAKTMDAKMNDLQINCPKKVERSFFLLLITNSKIMNEDYFSFYIDSLEVFAIQKWENLK